MFESEFTPLHTIMGTRRGRQDLAAPKNLFHIMGPFCWVFFVRRGIFLYVGAFLGLAPPPPTKIPADAHDYDNNNHDRSRTKS